MSCVTYDDRPTNGEGGWYPEPERDPEPGPAPSPGGGLSAAEDYMWGPDPRPRASDDEVQEALRQMGADWLTGDAPDPNYRPENAEHTSGDFMDNAQKMLDGGDDTVGKLGPIGTYVPFGWLID
jgi:hypothetical protein